MTYLILKVIHILSGAVLFGTGAGIAFFMLRAHATKDPRTVASVGRIVVLADFVFTASAVVVQPISGLALIHLQGYSLTEPWLMAAYALYVLIGVCWLPGSGSSGAWLSWPRGRWRRARPCRLPITACSGPGSSSDGRPLRA